MSQVYSMIDPAEPYDPDKIERRLVEIERELTACAKLKPGPWYATAQTRNNHWHDAEHTTTRISCVEHGTEYDIAGTTIYQTQREGMFIAAMREAFPEALRLERAALVQLQTMLVREARRKRRRSK